MTDWSARVKSDPGLRHALETARAWQVRPSVFLGDPSVTTHEHDAAGRLVRSTAAGWSAEDRDLALALNDYEAGLCGGCRAPLDETTAAEAEDAYIPGLAVRCHRCTASERASEFYRESPQPSALMIPIHRREPTT